MPSSAFNQHVFPSGFRVIHERPLTIGISAIQLLVDFGSAHESDGLRGAAHFIEHMCFKGTRDLTSTELFIQQNQMGNSLNASTGHRYTNYHTKINDGDLGAAVRLLANMTLLSTFPAKEFVKEERVIVEECLRDAENGMVVIEYDSMALLYAGSSFEKPIDHISYHHKLKSTLGVKEIKSLYQNQYLPKNMILSIVSDMPWKKILDIVRRSHFLVGAPHGEPCLDRVALHPGTAPPTGKIAYHFSPKPGSETAHVSLAFRVCDQNHPDRFILNLLQHIVSGNLGSKLFIFFREKHGITYVSRCETSYNEFAGDISFYVQVDKHKFGEVLPLLVFFINDLIRHGVTADELRVGKMNKRAKLHLSLLDLEAQAEYNAREWLLSSSAPPSLSLSHDAIVPLKKLFDVHYKNITQSQILEICRKYLRKSNMVACFVGLSAAASNKTRVERECEKIIH